ncbi:MAG: hypothetical protein K2Q33_02170 [Gammaproteobacteria bacterium]|nr:hypothetical protein [Gammaproteobacteria bacterium]
MSKRLTTILALTVLAATALADNSNPSVTFLTTTSKPADIKIMPSQSLPSFVNITQNNNNTHISGHLPFFASAKNLSGIAMNFNVFSNNARVCSFTAKISEALKVSITSISGGSCHFSGQKTNLDPFAGATFHLKLDNSGSFAAV